MAPLEQEIERLDPLLFSFIESQTTDQDKQALLALHGAVAAKRPFFSYLEIGSYLGGSLQVAMRDPRCECVISIDTRPSDPPDNRGGSWHYDDNSTAHMRTLLNGLPGVDMSKLTTFECGTDALTVEELPSRPSICFIDGEHTDAVALRDARFCAEATGGTGILAFHDYEMIKPAILAFLREAWSTIRGAVALTSPVAAGGGVFAIELGDWGLLRSPIVDRAVGSRWHSFAWNVACRSRRSSVPLVLIWQAIPVIDEAVAAIRARIHRSAST